MLKIRIIPVLLYSGHSLVKSIGFEDHRRVGTPLQAIRVYNFRSVDELVFLDIAAAAEKRIPDTSLIDELADHCSTPFAVGGGIRSVDHVRELLRVGADKVIVNTGFVQRPGLAGEISARFGRQCLVVSIDARRVEGGYRCYVDGGREKTLWDPVELARLAEREGAGEILLTSIDNDGRMAGYDLDLVSAVSSAVSIPVIVSGGAGQVEDFEAALVAGASALSAASIFHFTEITPLNVKQFLAGRGRPVRL